MANTKISGLTALATPAGEDLLAIVDDPSGTPTSKKITVETLLSAYTVSSANTAVLKATGYSLTGSDATGAIDIAGTWNTTGTPTGIKVNITDTASNASSLLMDLQVGGSSKVYATKDGWLGVPVTKGLHQISNTSYQIQFAGDGYLYLGGANGVRLNGTLLVGGYDTILARDAANTLALRNSTNAQTFNIYNTYTDASNYERGFVKWSSNVLQIGQEVAGTGSNRQVNIIGRDSSEGDIYFSSAASGNTNVKVIGSIQCTTTSIVGQLLRWGGFSGSSGNVTMDGRNNNMLLIYDYNGTAGAGFEMIEMTAPSAPSANRVRIYAEDNGSGKTRLMALFPSGAAQQIAIEP